MNKDTAPKGKEVIYVDVDDEITGIIEKVKASSQRIVALVLPKRATMLQSVVNMKLLKRAGETANKHIVLITAESGLLPLAASAGIHVAKSLQSKPEVPDSPVAAADDANAAGEDETAIDDSADASSPEPAADKSKTLGELSGDDEDEAPIELDNAEEPEAAAATSKGKKARKFKIPNFNKFRLWLLLGGAGVILLIGGIVWALVVMPHAEVTISTDSSAITSSREVLLTTGEGAELNADEGTLPAQQQEITRTQRAEVDATGEKNEGKKAKGEVTMTAQVCAPNLGNEPNDVPAGTGLSAGGKTYITQDRASFSFLRGSGSCVNYRSNSVDIIAQDAGSDYNVSNQKFAVAGRSNVDARGSAKGGTDNIVKIVSQSDIDKAKQQITERESDAIKQELQGAFSDNGLLPIPETFNVATSNTDISAQPGDEADSVTVTEEVVYSMLGVKQADLERIISADIADDIDPARQTILDYGLADASYTLQNRRDNGVMVGLRTVVVAGPDLNVDEIKKQIAGKKANDAKTLIGENPGVTNVEVTYGPFWVRSIPSNPGKISVTIEEPEAAPEETNNNDTTDNNAEQE